MATKEELARQDRERQWPKLTVAKYGMAETKSKGVRVKDVDKSNLATRKPLVDREHRC